MGGYNKIERNFNWIKSVIKIKIKDERELNCWKNVVLFEWSYEFRRKNKKPTH
jgi:hypothetical protein